MAQFCGAVLELASEVWPTPVFRAGKGDNLATEYVAQTIHIYRDI